MLVGPLALSRDGHGAPRVSLWCDNCFGQQHVGMLVEPLGLVADVDASTGVAVVIASPGLQSQQQQQLAALWVAEGTATIMSLVHPAHLSGALSLSSR